MSPLHTPSVYNKSVMSKRLNIILPDATVKILDRVTAKGDRSRFISQAVLHYVQTRGAANLRERLKQGALANAKLDLEIAEEWFPLEQEAWEKLDREERARKTTRGGAKSTSRRSIRR
jgi:CopG family transcriptional regulator / antitoxin EndoAI